MGTKIAIAAVALAIVALPAGPFTRDRSTLDEARSNN